MTTGNEQLRGAAERNAATVNRWMHLWFRNLRRNCGTIDHDFTHHGDRNASNAVPNWFREEGNGCALVLGSGPSLDLLKGHEELLRNWKGLIICGASNATIPPGLSGRYPDIILAVDASIETWMQLRWAPFSDQKTHLLTNTYIDPKVLSLFHPWQRYYYKSFLPYSKHPMNWYLTLLFNDVLENFMLQAGCTVNAEVAFCSLPFRKNLQGENELIIEKVFLLGADFAYPLDPEGRYPMDRAAPFRWVEGYGWTRPVKPPRRRTRSLDRMSNNGLLTDMAMLGYKRSLLTLVGILRMPTYNCSPISSIVELPRMRIGEVLESQGQCAPTWDHKAYRAVYKEYMKNEGPDIFEEGPTEPPPPINHELEVDPNPAQAASRRKGKEDKEGDLPFITDFGDPEALRGRVEHPDSIHVVGDQTLRNVKDSAGGGPRETTWDVHTSEDKKEE